MKESHRKDKLGDKKAEPRKKVPEERTVSNIPQTPGVRLICSISHILHRIQLTVMIFGNGF